MSNLDFNNPRNQQNMSNLDFNNPQNTPSQVDDLIAQFAGSILRHGLTAAAGALVSLGALQSDQSGQFVTIGLGIVMYVAGQVWSFIQKKRAARG